MVDVVLVTPDRIGPADQSGHGAACHHYAKTLASAGRSVALLFSGSCEAVEAACWAAACHRVGIGLLTLHDVPHHAQRPNGNRWYSERALALMEFLRRRDDRCILFQDWQANGFWAVRAKQMGTGFGRTMLGIFADSPTEWRKAAGQTFGANPLEEADLAWMEREAIAGADLLVSPSRHKVDWLRRNDFALPGRIEICPQTFEAEIRPNPNVTPDLSHIIIPGGPEADKRWALLGGALRRMPAEFRPRRVSLLGREGSVDGIPNPDDLANLAAELPDIAVSVRTDLDHDAAIAFLRRENGLVVMPSTQDSPPPILIAAIANGLPILACETGGTSELADPAILFRPSVESLAAKLSARASIDFARLRHAWSPGTARDTWLRTTATLLGAAGEAAAGEAPRPAVPPAAGGGLAQTAPPPSGPAAPAINQDRDGVSICIPFYYHDRYMPRLINALLGTSDENTQFVFINDGTPEVDCPAFLALARRLEPLGHVFHTQENAGPGVARNKAVRLARHERVIFFDSDNVPFPSLVPALSRALTVSGADIVSSPFIAVPGMLRQPTAEDALYRYHPPGGSMMIGLLDNVFGDTCCITTRRVMEAVGGFQTRRLYTEDWEFYLQAKGRGFRQIMHTDPLFYYTFEENVRRSQTSDYNNRTVLWSRLESMKPDILAHLLRSFVHQVHVRPGGEG